jgi:glycosyltransferase involved in cell wall biosynthesis
VPFSDHRSGTSDSTCQPYLDYTLKANSDGLQPLRVVVVMALSSPWSRLVVERLSSLGVVLHVVDFERRGVSRDYLDSRGSAQAAYAKQLEGHVEIVHRVSTPRFLVPRLVYSAKSLRRIAQQADANLILTLYGGSYATMALLSGIRPYVVYVVGSDVLRASWLERRSAKVTLTRAAAVIANGKFLAHKTSELVPRATVTPLYLGADLDTYYPSATLPDIPTFICTRGFDSVYDNQTIIRSLSHLGDELLAMRFCFTSSGPQLPDSIEMADALLTSKLRERVGFFGGVSDAELKTALRSASFYLSASLSDGTSSSMLEAMACGLFPIVSDIPANREWITHGKNGLLFPPGDHRSLADSIRKAVGDDPWIANARVANRRLVEKRADTTVNMATLVKLLNACRMNRVNLMNELNGGSEC